MKVLTNSKEIRTALEQVRPLKVAVAFVGEAWSEYVSTLEEIIVSPTVGSNPKAIEQLIADKGIRRVHFLDNLHSKIYLGENSAVVGSCNLSVNGLADSRLLEAAIELTDDKALRKLNETFAYYKARAKQKYPNAKSKRARLRELMEQWTVAKWHGLAPEHNKQPLMKDYRSELDRIHVAWYQPTEADYDENVIRAAIPDANDVALNDYISDFMLFVEEDDIRSKDWILCWRCRNDGFPVKSGAARWMHVHHVVPHGVHDETYTKLAAQANDKKCPPPPFRLDNFTRKLIRDALSSGRFPELVSVDDLPWRLAPADAVVPAFLQGIAAAQRGASTDGGKGFLS